MRSIYARQEDIERTHRAVTNEYILYVQELGEATEEYLRKLVATRPDPRFGASDRQSLLSFRDFWRDIHEFLKPSRDADTLHSPVALIEQLEDLLSRIPGLDGCRLLICHTPEANYIQFPRTNRRQIADHYAHTVPRAPGFPQKMAFIAIPYSQESSLFHNLIICHEMGHFVFEELGLESDLSVHIENALQVHFPNMVSDPDSQNALSWCRELLWGWAEEIYCDRFAIGLIGPAYSFSYIEMFDVIGAATGNGVNDFSDTHPSDSCRFKEHAEQLECGHWWPLLDHNGKSHADLIRKLRAIPEDQYVFASDERPDLQQEVLRAFLVDVKPHVAGLVTRTFQGQETAFRGQVDVDCIGAVQRYLCSGVVPATIVHNGQLLMPDPSILINAAYLFYLDRVPELIDRVQKKPKERSDPVSERDRWGQRAEQWTLKAMEDLRLPARRKPWRS
jgi:hypothetical protein